MVRLYFYLILIVTVASCKKNFITNLPAPTDKTYVKMDMEEGSHKDERQLWLEKIHGGKNSDWQNIEYHNSLMMQEYKRTLPHPNRDGEEWLADGKVYGKWIERGSNNQAGSAMNAYYDREEDILYAIGAGGPMFKGKLNGDSWSVVNDDVRFDENLLEIITTPSGKKRLIAGINGTPHYSEDFGKTWVKSSGVQLATDGRHIASGYQANGIIFVLAKKDWWTNYVLYTSQDGEIYTPIKTFSTNENRKIDMTKNSDGSNIYVIEQITNNRSRIYNYNLTANKLDVIKDLSQINFGSEGTANIDVVTSPTDTIFYSYDDENNFFRSIDKGNSWQLHGKLQTTPWNVGVFVSPSNPNIMLYGEVDAFRGTNAGKNWNRMNHWYEYYDNVANKLHADIMFIREFKDKQNKDVIVIGHHGGISTSYDYGINTKNITLKDFNVSQYYDVKTDPNDVSVIYAGSQDQGMQRGFVIDEITSDFTQMISGDYGHITFTNQGQHMWIMYPGGSISFYYSPIASNWGDMGYEITHGEEAVWIPPVMASPHETEDIVYVAGGSANASQDGSYIIKLKVDKDNDIIIAENLPFDFTESGGTVSAMAISPFDENIWYVATDNGKIYKSTDGGLDFTLVSSMISGAHYLYGSCIYPSKIDPNVVYITGNGYGSIAPVYVSNDGGNTFVPMRTGMLPTVAFELVANEDESKLYAATEAGPYVYLMNEEKWFPLTGTATPIQTYWSVEYINEEKIARFGTYGRGIWDFKDLTIESKSNEVATNVDVKIFPNPTSDFITISSKDKITSLDIVYPDGKKIQTINKPNESIPVHHLLKGQYLMIIQTNKNKITKSFTKI